MNYDLHIVYRFTNGYGLSICKGDLFNGYEIALLKVSKDGTLKITHKKEILDNDGVVNRLTYNDVKTLITEVRGLPKRKYGWHSYELKENRMETHKVFHDTINRGPQSIPPRGIFT